MTKLNLSEKLSESFYQRDAVVVAKELLGKIFVRKHNNKYLTAKIVETEAYKQLNDEAAHSYNGKTLRNSVMFENGGKLYVYFTYGKHFCANVVTGKENSGDAVLLRAFEPLNNLETLAEFRFNKSDLSEKEKINLCNGPAKLCQSFNILRSDNGKDFFGDEFFILNQKKLNDSEIVVSERIGIKKSVNLPWRFYIKDNPYISKK